MKILLAIDDSYASEAALDELARRCWPAGTVCEVVTVVDRSRLWTASDVADDFTRHANELAQRAAQRLQSCGLSASALVLSGNPKEEIVHQAEQSGADFVIVGSHGPGGITKFLLGSVAKAVIRFAPCSVDVVRAPTRNASDGLKILFATDGSESSVLAAHSVAERPWPPGTTVKVLCAAEVGFSTLQTASLRVAGQTDPWPGVVEPPLPESQAAVAIEGEARQQALEAVNAAELILRAGGLESTGTISTRLETPRQIILDEAAQWGADLIVLGSHGHSRIERFLLGSVSEAVAMHAACSVEVIRSPRAERAE
jgi:nucleotide-binding universal stress UspA family protein